MTTLDKKAAFFHVIDSHRWLAASGCAWNAVRPGGTHDGKFDQDLPNIIVMIRDCLLLHARSLIKFYKSKGANEDIMLSDFDVPAITSAVGACLGKYERPIEVHLFHLTDWRDSSYRGSHTPKRGTTARPDWDVDAAQIAELILDCLKYVSAQKGSWQAPFRELHAATDNRYRDKSYVWPLNLGEWPDVERYLKGLGL